MIRIFLMLTLLFGAFTLYRKGDDWKTQLRFKAFWCHAPRWMKEQIQVDLNRCSFDPKCLDQVMEESKRKVGNFSLGRYLICKNRLAECAYSFVNESDHNLKIVQARGIMIEESFKRLLKLVRIPDVDLIVCLEDTADEAHYSGPVFAFAKNSHLSDPIILMPDFEALSGNPELLNEVHKGMKKYPWDQKISQAFWRGGMTGSQFTLDNFLDAPRSKIVALSLEIPHLLDAKYTGLCQCDQPDEILRRFGEFFASYLSVEGHLKYKYQVLIDGNTCAYSRAYWQLFSNSVMFKGESPHIQWYYRGLISNVHYIPFRGDLIEKITWAKEHDLEARQISRNAQQFAAENLTKANVYLYLYHLLTEYGKSQQDFCICDKAS